MLLPLPYTEYLGRLAEPRNIADIVLVFFIVYAVLKLVRGTRAAPMAAAIAAFALLYWLAVVQDLATLEFVLRGALLYIGVAIIVLFQSEIRQALISFGNRVRMPFTRRHRGQFGEGIYDEIVLAATTLASTKTGALVVIERGVGLKNVTDGGVKLDAELSYDLLVTIFNPATPLHDGAVVVRRHRVAAAACFLPLTLNPRLSKDLGTRHRAALGITEDTDAVAVVVSEETGLISFVQAGKIKRGLDATKLRASIFQALEVPTAESRREKAKPLSDTEAETKEIVST
ncbi:MAG TPA: diadenylate cyclase CdaA [Pyrinomonadaceae bacterium]|jgi:diadenylate cyclase|nr:diadenylate cyclase CdaA [Pyrinomonadaceae bacterium]